MPTKLLILLVCVVSVFGSSCELVEIGPSNLVITPDAPQAGDNVHFTAPYDSNSLRYEWDFGNGLTSSTVSAEESCTYSTPGAYTVTVEVHYADNSTRTFSDVVNVQ